jgi:hypothetical protein
MISRRAFLLASTATLGELAMAAGVLAQAPKKKLKKANDSDGKNNVIGAWWEVDAVRTGSIEKRTFRFRAKDGVLYNRTGQEVGSLKPVKPTESLITWKEPLPLQGEFKITMNKVGRWGGVLTTEDGKEWKCLLKAIDR